MIHIIDKYYYEFDESQYVLYECGERNKIDIKTKKPTDELKEYQDCLGYYTSLEGMLNKVIKSWGNSVANAQNIKTISKHIEILSGIRDDVLKATKGF